MQHTNSEIEQISMANLIKDGRVMAVPLSDVATYYNFEEVNEEEIPKEDNVSLLEDAKSFVIPAAENNIEEQEAQQNYTNLTVFKWDETKTNFLLNEYANLIGSVGKFQRFRTKKLMWKHIANKMEKKFNVRLNSVQVETRFKVVCNRKKKGVLNTNLNSESGDEDMNDTIHHEGSRSHRKDSKPGRFLKKTDVVLVIPGKNLNAPDPFDVAPSPPPLSPLSSSSILSPAPLLSPTRSMSPVFQSSDTRNMSGTEKILHKMLEQTNRNFLKYFTVKERRDEEKLNERRIYHNEKLKILKEMAIGLDLKYRRK